jgi:hypothetical protein
MENAPVITLMGGSPYPGVDPDVYARFQKWAAEVYNPLLMKVRSPLGMDIFQIIRECQEYPFRITIGHFENLPAWEKTLKNPDSNAVTEDIRNWGQRRVHDYIWSAVYQLVKGFRGGSSLSESQPDTRVENVNIIYLEAFRLVAEDQDKYNKWLNDYGFNILPLFTRLPGLIKYDYFKHIGFGYRSDIRETEYPAYLSLIYFADLPAFENYEKSPELVTFRKTLRNVFPRGLNYKWDVQYQLTKSWRK